MTPREKKVSWGYFVQENDQNEKEDQLSQKELYV